MERIKRMLAMFLSILMVFTIVPVQNFVWAMPNTGITFILTEDGGNKVIPESYELTISTDPDGKSILNGAVTAKENTLVFTPETGIMEGTTYYYTLQESGYKKYTGTFDGVEHALTVQLTTKDKLPDLDSAPLTLTYGDVAMSLKEYLVLPEDYEGVPTYYISEGESVLSLVDDQLAPLKAGTAMVHVTLPETDTYVGIEGDIQVIVEKKDLGTLTKEDVVFEPVAFTYDGTTQRTVNGCVTSKLLEKGDTLSVTALATAPAADTGSYDAAVTGIQMLDNEKYTASFEESGATVKMDIQTCPVNVTFDKVSVVYGSLDWYKLKRGSYDTFFSKERLKELLHAESNLPESTQKEVTASMLNAAKIQVDDEKITDTSYTVGTYEGMIHLSFNPDLSGNFQFQTGTDPSLSITTETTTDDAALWDKIEIKEKSKSGSYTDKNTTYLSKDGYVTYQVKEDGPYDSVAIKINGEYSDTVTGTENSGSLTGTFYLYNSKDPKTRTDADSKEEGEQDNVIPKDVLVVDADGPTVWMNGEESSPLVEQTEEDLDFTTQVGSENPSMTGTYEDIGSGMGQSFYTVLAYDAQEDGKTLKEKVEELATTEWKSGEAFDLDKVQDDGYYVVLAKAQDRVGNTSYHAWGFVKDTQAPNIAVRGLSEGESYATDVDYELEVSDLSKAVSGLSQIIVSVTADGKTQDPKETESTVYTDSFQLTQEEINALVGTDNVNPSNREELGKSVILPCRISKEWNVSGVKVRIQVQDQAGNQAFQEYQIHIDTDAPEVLVSYDDNNVKNESYFNKERTATVQITERSYEERNLSFCIGIDGIVQNYTISDIEKNLADGVTLVKKDRKKDTYVLRFGEKKTTDHDYTFDVSLTDTAGNPSRPVNFTEETRAGAAFTIDKVPVKASLTFQTADGKELAVSDQELYINQQVQASINIEERNYDTAGVEVEVSQTDAAGNVVEAYDVKELQKVLTEEGLNQQKVNGSYNLPVFTGDANYLVSIKMTDKAGNMTTVADKRFTVDQTAPTGSLLIQNGKTSSNYTKKNTTASFQYIGKDKVTVDQAAVDTTSGIDTVAYYLYVPDIDAHGEFEIPDAETFALDVWKKWPGSLWIDSESQSIVYLKITDKAGNSTYINANDGIIIDKTATEKPEIMLDTEKTDALFNSDVAFTFTVTDMVSNGTYAGLKEVTYEVVKDEEVTQSETYRFEDKTARVKSTSKSATVSAALNHSDHVTIRVTATDYAGNTSSVEKNLKIDTDAPKVLVSYDNNDVKNGSYFNRKRTATVQITEHSYEEKLLVLSIGIDGEVQEYALSDLKDGKVSDVTFLEENTDGDTITYRIVFGDGDTIDHDYTFDVSLTDKAGNVSLPVDFSDDTKAGAAFTIDMVPVQASLQFQTEDGKKLAIADQELYVNQQVLASISIKERNYDGVRASVELIQTDGSNNPVAAYDKAALLKILTDKPQDIDKTYDLPIFTQDANYLLSIQLTDKAGNVTTVEKKRFTVDQTAPTGSISIQAGETSGTYTKNNTSANFWHIVNHDVVIDREAADVTSGVESVEYYLYQPKTDAHGYFQVPQGESFDADVWKEWPGKLTLDPEGQCIVYLKITDKAKNSTYIYAKDGIIIDKTATDKPEITLDTGTDDTIFNQDVPFTFTVTDPVSNGTYAGLKSVTCEILNNNEVTQSETYRFEDKTARVQSTSRSETVLSKINNGDQVTVRVSAIDYAGNHTMAEKKLKIDIDAPKVQVSYDNNAVRNGSYFNKQRTATVQITEHSYDEELLVFSVGVDGKVQEYSVSDLKKGKAKIFGVTFLGRNDGEDTITYRIAFAEKLAIDHDYTFDVSLTDKAGNPSEPVAFASGTKAGEAFTIDMVPIQAGLDFKTADGKKLSVSDDDLYLNQQVLASVYVNERNYDASGIKAEVVQTDGRGNTVAAYDKNALLQVLTGKQLEQEKVDGNFELPAFANDANYLVSLKMTDKAGNVTTIENKRFTVDRTAPTGNVMIKAGESNGVYMGNSGTASFQHIVSHEVSIDREAADVTSGVESVEYYLYTPKEDAHGEFEIPNAETIRKSKWKEWQGKLTLDPEGQYIVYLKITDKAGNITYINANDGIIIDKTAPKKPSITLDIGTEDTIFNQDVPFTFAVTDPASNGTYAGLKSVTFEVLNNGIVTQTGTYRFEDKAERVGSVSYCETILAKRNNSDKVTIRVTAVDYAGHVSTAEKNLKIDIDNPKVSIAYDNNDVKNAVYFNKARTATVQITERSYQEDLLAFTVGINGKEKDYSVSELQKGNVAGVTLFDKKETEEGIIYRLSFGDETAKDQDYTLDVSLKDKAGNYSDPVSFVTGTKAGATFTVDMIPIQAELMFKTADGEDISISNQERYLNQQVMASISIRERNYDAAGVEVEVVQMDANGNTVAAYDQTALRNILSDRRLEQQEVHGVYDLPNFTNDANYLVSLKMTDKAGNVTAINNKRFTVDQTAPTGNISIQAQETSGTYTGTSKTASFQHVVKHRVTIDRTVTDVTSGVQSVQYYIYTPSEDAHGEFEIPDAGSFGTDAWRNWSDSIYLDNESQSIIYLKVTDKAGNITYINSRDGVIVDKTAPEKPVITLQTGNENTVFSGDVPFSFSVTDPVSGGTYAGLQTVTCEVIKDGIVTQSNTYRFDSKASRVKAASHNETVIAARNNSNHVTIRVTAVDQAGNIVSAEKQLKIDITAPKIELSYDKTTENSYYNGDRTATIRVYERNFDPADFTFDVKSALGNTATIRGWSLASNMGESDEAVSTATVVFAQDDTYTVTASMKDLAGNAVTLGRTDQFTIDQTRPVVQVSFDKGSPVNGRYYNTTRTATITVMDRNFDKDSFQLSIKAEAEGKDIQAPSISGWSEQQDVHKTTIQFQKDGDYSFTCMTKDLAGNMSETEEVGLFTIDTTAPELSFGGIEDKTAYNSEVHPNISYTDINAGPRENLVITLEGARHERKTVLGTYEALSNGGRLFMKDFDKERSEDDVYTLTAAFTDLAGNKTEKSITFSINRFGSNFTFNSSTKQILDTYYLKNGKDLMVYETNVDSLIHKEITMGFEGKTTTLREGTDYQVTESSDHGWKVYTYTIKAATFEKEGIYEIVITSTDAAGNTQDNKLKESPIRLVVDKTPPSAIITGIENKARYNMTKKDATIKFTDNYQVEHADIYINGKVVENLDMQQLEDIDGFYTLTIKEADSFQDILVKTYDAAGNETESEPISILVTTDKFAQFFYNRPLFIGSIIGGAVIIVGLYFVFIGFKRKRK